MIRVLKHLAALLLCFCVICSLCGITFASGVDPDKIQMLEDWALSLEASASLDRKSKSPGGNICTRKIPTIKKLPNSRKKAPKKR